MKRVNIRTMIQGSGELVERYLENGETGGRILCAQNMIPSSGQYILAHNPGSTEPLPASIFYAGSIPGGFLAAPPIPESWQPGVTLSLRGPLGRGFTLPTSVKRVAFVALGKTIARLKPLLSAVLEKKSSVVLVTGLDVPDLPPEVEIQSLSRISEIARWADFLAIDVMRESLPGLHQMLGLKQQANIECVAQTLVVTPMPCGGMADCGVCAVKVRRSWKMACKDGPVFDLKNLI